jgi:G3E family GTPase
VSDTPPAPLTANLLTGFLGSGKTTLLRRLLRSPRLADSAVLINELGEVGLDHLLVEAVDEEVVLLKSGCLCCTIRGELKEALLRLLARRHRGEIPPFSRVVIETTGLAEPGPLVATLTADPMLRWQFRLGAIVTVVDAVNGGDTLDRFAEAAHQVAVADRLVLSKTDLAEPAQAAALAARLGTINPTATLTPSSVADDALADLIVADLHDPAARAAEVRQWLGAGMPDEAGHGPHRPEVRAHLLSMDEPVDWAAFGLWLAMLLNRHGDRILRVKGLLRVAGIAQPVVVQGVQHLIHEPQHLAAWPSGLAPGTRLVVIARDLDRALLDRSFRTFLGLAAKVSAA